MILEAFLFGIFLLVLEYYSFQAIYKWVQSAGLTSRRIVWVLYALGSLAAYFFLAVFILVDHEEQSRWLQNYGRAWALVWIVSKVPLAALLIIDDLRRLFVTLYSRWQGTPRFDASRSRFLLKAGLGLAAVPLSVLTYGMVRNGFRYRLHQLDIPIEGLPEELDGFKIIQISDIHSGSWTEDSPVHRAVEIINAQQADIICFTGDLVNSVADEMQPFIEVFRRCQARYGVFSVRGNHDYGDYHHFDTPDGYQRNTEAFEQTHADMGWELLSNEHRMLDVNGRQLAVIGVENWSAIRRFPRKGDLAQAQAGTEAADVRILLSHDPTHWTAQVIPDSNIELTLSGHTHGFQFGIEIPGFRWSPAQYMYKQWAGLYRKGQQALYVNRGLGFLGYPGRVGILPEVTLLKLRKK